MTVFYDASGRQEYVHQGAYPSADKLSADIEKYTPKTSSSVGMLRIPAGAPRNG